MGRMNVLECAEGLSLVKEHGLRPSIARHGLNTAVPGSPFLVARRATISPLPMFLYFLPSLDPLARCEHVGARCEPVGPMMVSISRFTVAQSSLRHDRLIDFWLTNGLTRHVSNWLNIICDWGSYSNLGLGCGPKRATDRLQSHCQCF